MDLPAAASPCSRQGRRRTMSAVSPEPTARELEALRLVCQPGSSMAQAAYELGVSPHAVHKRLLRIYARTGTNTAAQAAYALWVRDRPTEAPDPR